MLNFIGSGSAFNTELGNTSAFYREGDRLFLIDCGCTVFDKLKNTNILNGVEYVHIYISHTHGDHIGSLSDLIFYLFFEKYGLQCKVNLYHKEDVEISKILNKMGVPGHMYEDVVMLSDYTVAIPEMALFIKPIRQNHSEFLETYGLGMTVKDKQVYYSADGNNIPQEQLNKLLDGQYDYFYQDTCAAEYEGNIHMSLYKLYSTVPIEHRDRVYCMHLDKDFDVDGAKNLGFNVVENYEENK